MIFHPRPQHGATILIIPDGEKYRASIKWRLPDSWHPFPTDEQLLSCPGRSVMGSYDDQAGALGAADTLLVMLKMQAGERVAT